MYDFVKSFLQFLTNNNNSNSSFVVHSKLQKIIETIKIWIFISGYIFISGILLNIFLYIIKYDTSNNKVESLISNTNIYILIISTVILAPILEELSFRLAITKKWIVFIIGLAIFYIVVLFLPNFKEDHDFSFLDCFPPLLIIISIFIISLNPVRDLLKKYLSRFYLLNFYIFTIAFGLIHLTNYENLNINWLFLPLLISPQLFLSFFLGFIRHKFGIMYSIFFHLINNLMALSPILILNFLGNATEIKITDYIKIQAETIDFILFANLTLAFLYLNFKTLFQVLSRNEWLNHLIIYKIKYFLTFIPLIGLKSIIEDDKTKSSRLLFMLNFLFLTIIILCISLFNIAGIIALMIIFIIYLIVFIYSILPIGTLKTE